MRRLLVFVSSLILASCGADSGGGNDPKPRGARAAATAVSAPNPGVGDGLYEIPLEEPPEIPLSILSLRVGASEVAHGEVVDFCMNLDVNNGRIAGAQADLLWDPICLEAVDDLGDNLACSSNPATGRSVFAARRLGPGHMRALLLDLTSIRPIPEDVQQLACCSFRVLGSAGSRCQMDLASVILSDPQGRRLPVEVRPGVVEVRD